MIGRQRLASALEPGRVMDLTSTSAKRILRHQDKASDFATALEIEMTRAARYERPLSLLSFTIVPRVEDEPEKLRYIASLLERIIRKSAATVFRTTDFWGELENEGLHAALIETEIRGALRARERFFDYGDVIELREKYMKHFQLTVGCAEFTPEMLSPEDFAARCAMDVVAA